MDVENLTSKLCKSLVLSPPPPKLKSVVILVQQLFYPQGQKLVSSFADTCP